MVTNGRHHSAASIAGLFKCCDESRAGDRALSSIPEGSRIVCTVTGHGLKDPEVAKDAISGIVTARAEKSEILRLI